MNEFNLIHTYFAAQKNQRTDVIINIGDDAAIVKPPKDQQLAITTDTLVAGVHFFTMTNPHDIGYKSLAVNLSDLAAMGAKPAWVLLALTMPQNDETWVNAFCQGFFALANRYQVQLIGGDLTRGPLAITVQAIGFTSPEQALLRSQAKPTDLIYVSGDIGAASIAIRFLKNQLSIDTKYQDILMTRLNRPEPRVALGMALREIATAAIDISDGLAADLNHMLDQSAVGATVYVDQLPLSPAVKNSVSPKEAIALALTGGDDYELCFTIPANQRAALEKILATQHCPCTCIGEITATQGLNLRYQNGDPYDGPIQGYEHF